MVSGYKAGMERPPREGDAVTTLPESFRSAHPRGEEMGRTLLPPARKGLISGPQRGTARAAPRGAGQAAEAEVGAEREWRRCWAGPDRAGPHPPNAEGPRGGERRDAAGGGLTAPGGAQQRSGGRIEPRRGGRRAPRGGLTGHGGGLTAEGGRRAAAGAERAPRVRRCITARGTAPRSRSRAGGRAGRGGAPGAGPTRAARAASPAGSCPGGRDPGGEGGGEREAAAAVQVRRDPAALAALALRPSVNHLPK